MQALYGSRVIGVGTGEGDRIMEGNAELLRIFGRPRGDLAGSLRWPDLTPSEHLERDAAALGQVRREGSAAILKDVLRPDGSRVPVLAVVSATGWDPYRWVAVVMDLSVDERLAHLALSEAAIVSTLLEDAPVGFALIDPDLRFVRVNSELAAMNGYSVAEHEGSMVFDLLPDIRETAEVLLRRVLETGEPLRDAEIVGSTPAEPGVEHVWLESFFPIRAPHGSVLGVAAIARDETRVRRLQRELAETSARQGQALEQFQHSLLPAVLPSPAGYTVAARYLPASVDVGMGGDWFDALLTDAGQLVLAVGDVVGHGVGAVGLMARAAAGMRAYVCEGHEPAQVLDHLDALLGQPDVDGLATAALAQIDPATGRLRYARAGHPYPLVVSPDGSVTVLDEGAGHMLGLRAGLRAHEQVDLLLEPGAMLVMYTDGLVERRAEPLASGIDRLTAALVDAAGTTDLELALEAVLEQCLDGYGRQDDICVLAVRRQR